MGLAMISRISPIGGIGARRTRSQHSSAIKSAVGGAA